MDPYNKSANTFIARTSPIETGIVDARILDPNPKLRILGGFAQPDVLILLTWKPRGEIDFDAEIARCRDEWNRLFPDHAPLIETSHDKYVTENAAAS